MPDIFELVSAKAIGEYVTTIEGGTDPLLGATLFPSKKIIGLDLKFVKGYKHAPIALRPSALGARAFVRDRIGGAVIQNELPFFREKMLINERLRQELARAKADVTDPYTASVIEQIFDDAKQLVDGAEVQSERLRMQLLFTGKIEIVASDKDGRQPRYAYDYDFDGKWAASNKTVITSATAKWSDATNSNPLADMQKVIEDASRKGVKLTKAIVSPTTWRHIVQNVNVKNMFRNPDGSQKIFSRDTAINEIETLLGVRIAVYNKAFVNENGDTLSYAADNAMVLIPDGALGATVYGTTPEEIDLMSGFGNGKTSIVNTGVAITTVKQYGPPVVVETIVSELVLPSFERMAEVFVISY